MPTRPRIAALALAGVLVPAAALAAILALARLLCGRSGSWGRWIAFAGVLPLAWFVLQVATWNLLSAWDSAG